MFDVNKFLEEAAQEQNGGLDGGQDEKSAVRKVESILAENDRWVFVPCGEGAWEASCQTMYLGSGVVRVSVDGRVVNIELRSGLMVPDDCALEMRKYMMLSNSWFFRRAFSVQDGEAVFSGKETTSSFCFSDIEAVVHMAVEQFSDLCAVVAGQDPLRLIRWHMENRLRLS